MPTTTPATTAASQTSAATSIQNKSKASLAKDDFLKLLVAQLQHQDPSNPADSSEFMAQMTQFSILEQLSNLAQSQQASASNDYDQQAVGLIGRTVTYTRRDGSTASGVVEQVTFTSRGPTLTINGEAGIPPVVVSEVR